MIDADLAQALEDAGALHAFGDHADAEVLAHRKDHLTAIGFQD
jgi:hypothetical protein